MKIDLEHLHYWMQAIRQSDDPMRTLDSFWQGQLSSKEWLCNELKSHVMFPSSVEIHGGWVGVLSSLIFQSGIPIIFITSIDIDPSCQPIAEMMNKHEEMQGKFRSVTEDMCDYESDADIVINTSFEHISQEQYEVWKSHVNEDSLIVLQTNNYDIPEHIRCANNIEEFVDQAGLSEVMYSGEIELPLYKRFMIIGKK